MLLWARSVRGVRLERRGRAGERAAERSREGLGLGLHIVHKIVHMHGGKVTGKTNDIAGTVFTVDLPRTAQSWVS